MKRLVPVAFAALLLLAACGGSEEQVPGDQTAAATATAAPSTSTTQPGGGGGGDIGPGTIVTPKPTPVSPAAIPADWATFTFQDFPGATFRYPATWLHLPVAGVYSWDPDTRNKPGFPADGIKLEASALPIDQSAREDGAVDFSLAGKSGWRRVMVYDPVTTDGRSRVDTVAVDNDGVRYLIIGYFGPKTADDGTFDQILSSLTFHK